MHIAVLEAWLHVSVEREIRECYSFLADLCPCAAGERDDKADAYGLAVSLHLHFVSLM